MFKVGAIRQSVAADGAAAETILAEEKVDEQVHPCFNRNRFLWH